MGDLLRDSSCRCLLRAPSDLDGAGLDVYGSQLQFFRRKMSIKTQRIEIELRRNDSAIEFTRKFGPQA